MTLCRNDFVHKEGQASRPSSEFFLTKIDQIVVIKLSPGLCVCVAFANRNLLAPLKGVRACNRWGKSYNSWWIVVRIAAGVCRSMKSA
jgi:hypothetical protein